MSEKRGRGRPKNPPGVPNHNPKFEIRLRPEVEAWAQQNRQRVAEMLERAAKEDGAL